MNHMENDPTKRFSKRVENYMKYRPMYPAAVLDCLRDECGLIETAVLADIGSGTGILTKLFLENGHLVYGVEPNQEMRQAAEKFLDSYPNFRSVNGTAEFTTLPTHSIDLITAGQAFHWFNVQKARQEFLRILKPDGYVALVWNERKSQTGGFMEEFEALLNQYAISYSDVKQTGSYVDIVPFFGGEVQTRVFANKQVFNWEGLRGRFLSSSYAPLPEHPNHYPMITSLGELFEKWQKNGRIDFDYETQLFWGQLRP